MLADREKLSRVIENLLKNALQYTPESGSVSVRTESSGRGVKLLVENSGPGIEAKDLPFIFERFYRGEKSRSRDYGGTGIGLAIVKEILEAHGGKAGVESIPGKTLFWFSLPRHFRPGRVLFAPELVRGRPRRASSYLTVSQGGTDVRLRANSRFPCQDEKCLLSAQKPRGVWSCRPELPDGHQVEEQGARSGKDKAGVRSEESGARSGKKTARRLAAAEFNGEFKMASSAKGTKRYITKSLLFL